MLKILPYLILAGLLSAPVILNELSSRSPRIDPVPSQPPPHSHGDPAPVCATGCSAATTPVEGLSEEAFEELLEQYSEHAFDEPSLALETLLFHSAEVRDLAERLGLGALGAEHAEFLEREIERGHARLSVRMLGEDGAERLSLGPVRVPLSEKQHLWPERSLDLQVPEISGTVRRVGVAHLWTRL